MDNGTFAEKIERSVKSMEQKKEAIRYLIWGVIGFIVNILLFQSLILVIDYRVAEIITLIFMKIFCYLTNKIFVFKTPFGSWQKLLKEVFSFMGARIVTSVFDVVGLIIMVDVLYLEKMFSKYFVTMVVIVLNYILSKKFVFGKNREDK